jgi:pyoverdine/dityrosine biosynthesis protein Dit1
MEDSWAWHPKPAEKFADSERVSIHAHIWLNEDALELEVNSATRAARGKAFIHRRVTKW